MRIYIRPQKYNKGCISSSDVYSIAKEDAAWMVVSMLFQLGLQIMPPGNGLYWYPISHAPVCVALMIPMMYHANLNITSPVLRHDSNLHGTSLVSSVQHKQVHGISDTNTGHSRGALFAGQVGRA